jgi:hypothetical protein
MSDGTIPLNEAAERMQSTPVNVLMHIKRGLLSGKEVDGAWFVDASSLEKHLRQRQEGVNTEVCQDHCKHTCAGCG